MQRLSKLLVESKGHKAESPFRRTDKTETHWSNRKKRKDFNKLSSLGGTADIKYSSLHF